MPVRIDPEESEVPTLLEYAGSFEGKRVLEIGCGDGRLTWAYAARAAHVVAIDPDEEEIGYALEDRPWRLRKRVAFHAIGVEAFDAPPESFDTALFTWSL
jgi:2-polyprenyl-3-methyl-5-hydroxy-6-metoxy-1,4-benzoquinol methylase